METLTTLLKRWPQLAQVDESDGRLRLVVEDPFVRDLLRNQAYAIGIPLDTSFANEIVSLRWSDYASLLVSVLPAAEAEEVATDVGAAIRRPLPSGASPDETMSRTISLADSVSVSMSVPFGRVDLGCPIDANVIIVRRARVGVAAVVCEEVSRRRAAASGASDAARPT